ncbi:GNAT family N-acetyltransferase [Glycomyces harbinensis]|uniref:Acetyltransferase (GNAT) family protein n=1 Tax=Glycomyces harbinensis TaxID=58114 RepID=A0A1G6WHU0_9ACTN|nr:GNAT family N-acetyltransferase [Glycomyces harbinensis]SDD64626.1 Acetyltransferase (GNAT) family protein [Glycomyces harbinensis]
MEIIEFGAEDPDLIDRAYAILTAAHQADIPENPCSPERFFRTLFSHVFPGRERHWFAAVEDGRALGYARLNFFTDENLELAMYELRVHPDHRGTDADARLRDRVERYAAEHGRTALVTAAAITWPGGPERDETTARTLEARGYTRALTTVNRRSPVDPLGAEEEQRRYDEALAKAGDAYEIRQWIGPVPDDLVDTMCRMETMIMSEIPLGEIEAEPEVMNPEKLRATEAVYAAEGRTWLASVAVERATGEVRAWTEIAIDEGDDRDARQGITIVDPAHRGHRLGLLLKLANLRQVRAHAPTIAHIWTDNADVNAPMIAINELMGYTTVDASAEYQKKAEA